MNGKQRVYAAIAREKTNRPALSYEATPEVTESLIEHLGLEKDVDSSIFRSGSNQPSAGEKKYGMAHELELQRRFGVDQAIVICPTSSEKTVGNWWGLPLIERLEDGKLLGAWGIKFMEFEYSYGTYLEIDSSPLERAESISQFVEHPSPSLGLWDFDKLDEVLNYYSDLFVWLQLNGCFDFARFTRSTEAFLVDLVLEPKKAEILLDKVNDLAINFFQECMKHVRGKVNGVFVGDDFGTQQGLLMSPEMWRKYIKPRYKKLLSVVKKSGIKYCHHSCGGIRPIIPDLIDIGVDVLHPVQPLAIGMDPGELGEEFGKDLTFYGGIDEQRTLPSGSPGDVKKEVRECINTLGKYGGYIVSPSHAFQPDTPLENVLAVYEEVLGYTPH
jgi:uroporphyrinogen decarboxylase